MLHLIPSLEMSLIKVVILEPSLNISKVAQTTEAVVVGEDTKESDLLNLNLDTVLKGIKGEKNYRHKLPPKNHTLDLRKHNLKTIPRKPRQR